MRIPLPPLRGLVMMAFAVGFVLVAIDGGSVVLTKMSSPDDVRSIAHVAAATAERQPTTPRTARAAYDAAVADAKQYAITVHTKGFTIYPDGRVTLTGVKTAPTIFLDRVAALRGLADVSTTVTVEPLPYTS